MWCAAPSNSHKAPPAWPLSFTVARYPLSAVRAELSSNNGDEGRFEVDSGGAPLIGTTLAFLDR